MSNTDWAKTVVSINRFFSYKSPLCAQVTAADGTTRFWYNNVYELPDSVLGFLVLVDADIIGNTARAINQYYDKTKHKKVILDFSLESPLMWPTQIFPNKPLGTVFSGAFKSIRNIFEVVHEIVRQAAIPEQLVEVYIANPYITDVYAQWCTDRRITSPLKVSFRDLWAIRTSQMELGDITRICAEPVSEKVYHFTSLNNKARPHRVHVLKQLHSRGLLSKGKCTFVFDADTKNKLMLKSPELANLLPMCIESDIGGLDHDQETLPGLDQYYRAIRDSQFSLITETLIGNCFNHRSFDSFFPQHYWRNAFFSEKIWRPVLFRKPFLLIGNPGQLAAFRELGFRTFDFLFDESYDAEPNHTNRIDMVLDQCEHIVNKYSVQELDALLKTPEAESVMSHNYEQFFRFIEKYSYDYTTNIVRDLGKESCPDEL
jgi:hypothetical protein